MSRIHEALQKKAAEAEGRTVSAPENAPEDGNGSDLFPLEPAERRRGRTGSSGASAPTPIARPVPLAAPTRESRTAPDERLSFERIDARYAGKVVVDQDISPQSREQYRRLAASLHHAQAATGLKVVMVTSAVMGEGKTLTSSNLALTLSESYQKNVLLIDADLRRPAVHGLFRLRNDSGLSEGLTEAVERKIPVHQVSSRLGILSAGRPTSDPIAGLTSARMRRLVEEARGSFDWIILDTPPVTLLPDANLLGSMADGAVVVVRAGSTPWDLVQRAVAALGQDWLLGVVLNGATSEQGRDYYYNYHYATQEPTTPA